MFEISTIDENERVIGSFFQTSSFPKLDHDETIPTKMIHFIERQELSSTSRIQNLPLRSSQAWRGQRRGFSPPMKSKSSVMLMLMLLSMLMRMLLTIPSFTLILILMVLLMLLPDQR